MTTTAGPAQGSLTLHTGVEGRLARTGHALTIAVGDWTATAETDGGALVSVALTARVDSLSVVSGTGGVAPLSPVDRRVIASNARKTLSAKEHPTVEFRSTAVVPVDGGYELTGDLTVAGRTSPVFSRLSVTPADGGLRVTGDVSVVQSAHGVSPYSTMLGALKVRDRVDVRYDVTVPAP